MRVGINKLRVNMSASHKNVRVDYFIVTLPEKNVYFVSGLSLSLVVVYICHFLNESECRMSTITILFNKK